MIQFNLREQDRQCSDSRLLCVITLVTCPHTCSVHTVLIAHSVIAENMSPVVVNLIGNRASNIRVVKIYLVEFPFNVALLCCSLLHCVALLQCVASCALGHILQPARYT